MFLLKPVDGKKEEVYRILKEVPNISVWKSGEVPARLNYGQNPRTLDLVVLADSTWSLGWGSPRGTFFTGGNHGWDNAQKDMHTIFYAMGPAFKRNHKHPPIEVVDLYPLIARILRLQPATVDGRLERTIRMLR